MGYKVVVNPVPPTDTVTITSGPSGTPNPVASGGAVSLSVSATDSLNHTLSYVWSTLCSGLPSNGSFSNASIQNPTWTAPTNTTGTAKSCTLTVTASDGGFGHSDTKSFTETVNAATTDTVTITSGPSGTPNPVASGGAVSLSVTATDTLNHTLSYSWSALCSGFPSNGTFSSANIQNPTWTAPTNTTGTAKSCTLTVTASDGGFGHSDTKSVTETVNAQGNRAPSISNAGQFRVNGVTPINSGLKRTPERTVIFKGTVSDPDGDQVKMEVELRQVNENFTGQPTPETISALVPSGTEVSIRRDGLVYGSYKWRARAVDSKGEASEWVQVTVGGFTDGFTIGAPVLLVHGWCGSPSNGTWGDMKSLLTAGGFRADFADYDSDAIGDLKELADSVGLRVDAFIADTYGPNQEGQIDIVAHSMGGLVTRAWIAGLGKRPYKNQIRRLILAATPNYGQPFGELAVLNPRCTDFLFAPVRGQQAEQMEYGHEFLWKLHQEWHKSSNPFASERELDVLTIVGTKDNLVTIPPPFINVGASAALPKSLLRYVNKDHSEVNPFNKTDGIVYVDKDHPTWKLVRSFLIEGNASPPDCNPDNECMISPPPDTGGLLLLRLTDASSHQEIKNWSIDLLQPQDMPGCGGAESSIDFLHLKRQPSFGTVTIKNLAQGCHKIRVPTPQPLNPTSTRYKSADAFRVTIEAGRPQAREVAFIPTDSLASVAVRVIVNGTKFLVGQVLRLNVLLQPQTAMSLEAAGNVSEGGPSGTAADGTTPLMDGYLYVEIPGGSRFFLSDLNLKTFTPNVTPVVSSFPATEFFGEILSLSVPGGLPIGSYTFFAVGVKPGTDPLNSANWVTNRDQVSVELVPDVP